MQYLLVKWLQARDDEPRLMYSELDERRLQRRKVDIYRDGRWGFADAHEESGGSVLGEAATPTAQQLNASGDYQAKDIEMEEFERVWAVRRDAPMMTPFPLNDHDE